METFGETIRKLRLGKKLPLRKVAAFLGIDIAILSKIERGQRKPAREMAVKLAEYFNVKEEELLIAWLSDRIVYETGDEKIALKALQVAEEKVEYNTHLLTSHKAIIQKIKNYLKKDKRVMKAWIFGSFARGDDDYKSDIDIMLRYDDNLKLSLFDVADIQYKLEQVTNRKIDIAEEGYIQPFAWKTAKSDLIPVL